MARVKARSAEAGLREYLLERAVAFRDRCGRLSDEAYAELSKPIDQLVGCEPYRLHGWELPEGHPALADYGLGADLLLGSDDQLRLHGSSLG
ncbi:hypothetical protein [Mycolicibacterium gadium]|uniref:Uncharacterized protein n=1 Tax=Mycolicibacterium gadium TaxID=1794 RepID=A0A7I7WHK3_MYCGU|nr:hypothetical protein [Mycolicibacterium gadium]BBZ17086.1 hypothetical protein MGAD_14210 [Mycolicibacterium gadium]